MAIATAFVTVVASTSFLSGAAAVPDCVVGPGADLTGCDLTYANLTSANLTSANLTSANLTSADLTSADLTNADLRNANLTGANLPNATIGGTNFDGATLTNITSGGLLGLPVSLPTNFSLVDGFIFGPGVNLTGSSLENLDLNGYNLTGANLTDANLRNANLTNANLTNATMTRAILQDANLTGATLPTSFGSALIYNTTMGSSTSALRYTGAGDAHDGDLAVVGHQAGTAIVIPEILAGRSVTSIGNSAFYEIRPPVTSVDLGAVQSIGEAAFARSSDGAVGIASIDLTHVQEIGNSAFYGVTTLTGRLTLGSNLRSIGNEAFWDTRFSGELEIPASVTTIGRDAFGGNLFDALTFEARATTTTIGNDAFKSITTFSGDLAIPDGVTSIGANAFEGTGFHRHLTIPNSLTSISDYAFSGSSFTSVSLGANLTSIGVQAFRDVPLTGPLVIPSDVTSLGAGAFYLTDITSVTFPSGLTSIGDEAFSGVTTLEGEVVLPTGLVTLGSAAFYGTRISGSLVIPNGITSIGDGTFYGTSLETVTLPRSLVSIGDLAFGAGLAGGTFTFEGNAPSISPTAFETVTGESADDLVIRYPEGASGWPMDPNPFGLRSRQIAVAGPPAPRPEPTSPTVDPSPPGVSQPAIAAPQQPVANQDPLQTPGTAGFRVNGQETPVRTESGPRGSGLTLQAGPVEFTLRGQTPNGQRVPLAPDGSLILPRTGEVPISGDGLEPNSTVVITLFSDPVSLGSTSVGADGTFQVNPVIPRTVPLGAHTLELSGRTKTGDPFVLSVGVLVETPAAALGADPVLNVRPSVLKPRASVAVTARGVQAGCRVTFTIAGERALDRASAKGVAQARITVPKRLPKTVVLRATVSGPRCSAVTVSKPLTSRPSATSKATSH